MTEPTITQRPDGYHVVDHAGGSDPFPTRYDAERFVEELKKAKEPTDAEPTR